MTEKLTIRDIARIAGVSPATVSRVLNNNPRVDLTLREHILRVVEEYHFIPDLSARQLRSRSAQQGQAGAGLAVKGAVKFCALIPQKANGQLS